MFGKNKSVSNTAASSGVFLEIDGSRPGTPSSQEESSSVKKKKRFSLFGNKNDTAIKNLEYVKERDAGTLNSLSKAICTNNIEKVKNILDIKKPNINDKDKTFKRNSIHWAAIQKTSIFMKLLMEYKNKKEPSDYEALDSCGQTPLCLAVIQKHTEIIRMLAPISKKSIDLLDKFGKNCLMYAVDNDDQFTSSVLLKHGANVNVKFHNGEAPLLVYAIKNRKTSSALELINWGADLNLVDEYERSPLYYAIQNQDVHLVKALVERGADTRQQDQQGESPQELSKKIKNKEFPEGKKENQDSPSIIIQNYVIYGTAKPSKINDHRSRSLDKIDMTPNKGASTPLSDGESPVITPALSKKSIKNGLSAEPSFELSPLSGSKDIEEVTELTESNDSVNTFGMVEKESPIKKITEEFDISDMSINNVVEDNIRDFGLRTPVEVAPVVCPSKSPSVLENFRKQCTRSAPLRDSSGELFYESDIIKAKSLGNTVKSKSFDKKRMISSEQEENDSNKLADSPLNRAKSARYPVRENVHLSLKKLPHLKITGASNPEMAADSAIQKESPLSAKEFRKKEIDMILKSLNEVRNETDQEEIVINPLIDPKRRVSVDILSPILKNRGSLKGEEKLVNDLKTSSSIHSEAGDIFSDSPKEKENYFLVQKELNTLKDEVRDINQKINELQLPYNKDEVAEEDPFKRLKQLVGILTSEYTSTKVKEDEERKNIELMKNEISTIKNEREALSILFTEIQGTNLGGQNTIIPQMESKISELFINLNQKEQEILDIRNLMVNKEMEAEKKINSLSQENTSKDMVIQQLKSQLEDLESDFQNKSNELKQKFSKLEEKHKELGIEKSNKEKNIVQLRNQIKELESIQVKKSEMESLSEEKHGLENTVIQLRSEIQDLKGVLENERFEVKRRISSFEEKIRLVEFEKMTMEKSLEQLKHQVKDLNNELALKNKEFLKQNKEGSESIEGLTKSQQENTIEQLKNQVKKLTMDIQHNQLVILDLETDLSDELEKNQSLSRVNEQLNNKLEEYREARNKPETPTERSQDEILNYQRLIRQKDGEISKLKRDVIHLKTEIEESTSRPSTPIESIKMNELKGKVLKKDRSYEQQVVELKGVDNLETRKDSVKTKPSDTQNTSLSSIYEEQYSSNEQVYSELSSEISALQHRLNAEIALKKQKEAELSDFNFRLEEITEELKENLKKLMSEKEEKHAVEQRNLELEKQLKTIEHKLQEANIDLSKQKEINVKLSCEVKRIGRLQSFSSSQQDCVQLSSMDDNSKKKVSELTEEIEHLKKQIKVEREMNESRLNELLLHKNIFDEDSHLYVIHEQLEQERELRITLKNAYESEKKEIMGAFNDMERELFDLKKLMDQDRLQTHDLSLIRSEEEKKLSLISDELKTMKGRSEELESFIAHQKNIIKNLEDNSKNSQDLLSKSLEKEKMLNMSIDKHMEEILKLKNEILFAEDQMYKLKIQEKQNIREVQIQVNDKMEIIEKKDKVLAGKENELNTLKQTLENLTLKTKEQKDRISSLEIDVKSKEKEVHEALQKLEKSRNSEIQLDKKLTELQNEDKRKTFESDSTIKKFIEKTKTLEGDLEACKKFLNESKLKGQELSDSLNKAVQEKNSQVEEFSNRLKVMQKKMEENQNQIENDFKQKSEKKLKLTIETIESKVNNFKIPQKVYSKKHLKEQIKGLVFTEKIECIYNQTENVSKVLKLQEDLWRELIVGINVPGDEITQQLRTLIKLIAENFEKNVHRLLSYLLESIGNDILKECGEFLSCIEGGMKIKNQSIEKLIEKKISKFQYERKKMESYKNETIALLKQGYESHVTSLHNDLNKMKDEIVSKTKRCKMLEMSYNQLYHELSKHKIDLAHKSNLDSQLAAIQMMVNDMGKKE